MSESSAAMDGMVITGQNGLLAGTHVASNLGWRSVDALCVGDKVLTFDQGMQPIVDIQRETRVVADDLIPRDQRPVRIPEGVLNNRRTLWLMPDQGVLIESDAACDPMGDPFAVVPARAFAGFSGIEAGLPGETLQVTTLAFEQDQVVFTEGGLLTFCPRLRSFLSDADQDEIYDVLDLCAARFLVETMFEQNSFASLAASLDDITSAFMERAPRPGRPQVSAGV
jgi:hypothetical protein